MPNNCPTRLLFEFELSIASPKAFCHLEDSQRLECGKELNHPSPWRCKLQRVQIWWSTMSSATSWHVRWTQATGSAASRRFCSSTAHCKAAPPMGESVGTGQWALDFSYCNKCVLSARLAFLQGSTYHVACPECRLQGSAALQPSAAVSAVWVRQLKSLARALPAVEPSV